MWRTVHRHKKDLAGSLISGMTWNVSAQRKSHVRIRGSQRGVRRKHTYPYLDFELQTYRTVRKQISAHSVWHFVMAALADDLGHYSRSNSGTLWRVISASELPAGSLEVLGIHYCPSLPSAKFGFYSSPLPHSRCSQNIP